MKNQKKSVFGTTEWCSSNSNYISGCHSNCKYCFSREMAVRFKRKKTENWCIEEVNFSKVNKKFKKMEGRIMFPSSHDISIDNIDYAIIHLKNILKVGNQVLIVSKPKIEVIERLCQEFSDFKEQILFRFTIGSTNSEILQFWEPGASSYEERKHCLVYAFENGFSTSVSSEPLLDTNAIGLVNDLEPYITDAIWLGKVNSLIRRLKVNGVYDAETMMKANDLLSSQTDDFFNDLFNQLRRNTKVKWKESIKKIVGLEISTTAGLDI